MESLDHTQYPRNEYELDVVRREMRLRGLPVPTGSRCFDIIEVLSRSPGELVTKDQLMERVWPGAIVGENTIQVHISAIRKALGTDRGLLKTVSGRGYRLEGDWVVLKAHRPHGAADTHSSISLSIRNKLPKSANDLIGRTDALEKLQDCVSAFRVVTLTGTGGIGKTRLALEIAHTLASRFEGRIALVEFASLTEPRLLLRKIADALGISSVRGEVSASSISDAIGLQELFLVLDNCEHVVEEAAEIVEQILRSCPMTSILVTSREHLRVDGEYVFLVPPLDVPRHADKDPENVLFHSASQLFIGRMAALPSRLPLKGQDLKSIAAICRRLDGIPLAIELAAARAAVVGINTVLVRLEDRFEILTHGRRAAPPRHQTLDATLDWSYDLLPEEERRMLRLLSVFPTSFTFDAITAVAGIGGTEDWKILEYVGNLVSKSLLSVEGSNESPRWRLLETTRAYARRKGSGTFEYEEAARRHAIFFRSLLMAQSTDSKSEIVRQRIESLDADIDNVRAALKWSFSDRGEISTAVELTIACVPVWLHFLMVEECLENVAHALERLKDHSEKRTRLSMDLIIALGSAVHFTTLPTATGEEILSQALETAEGMGDPESQLRALWVLFGRHVMSGKNDVAKATAYRFKSIAEKRVDLRDSLVGDRLLSLALHYEGNQNEARRLLDGFLRGYTAPDDDRHQKWFQHDQRLLSHAVLARIMWLQGFVNQAEHLTQLSINQAKASKDNLVLCYVLANTACRIYLEAGNYILFQQSFKLLIDVAERSGGLPWSQWLRCLEGEYLIKRGKTQLGADIICDVFDNTDEKLWMMHFTEHVGALAWGLRDINLLLALKLVDENLSRADMYHSYWYRPEDLRIKGELLLRCRTDLAESEAEECFRLSLAQAKEQGAAFWELRTASSLAQLMAKQDRRQEARAHLRSSFEKMVEGFHTVDFLKVKAQLAELDEELR